MRSASLSWALLALLAQLGGALPARADSAAVLLPILSDPDIPAASRAEAFQHTLAALESMGYTVRDLTGEALERFTGCDDERCAAAAREATAARVTVQVRLFHDREERGRASELVLTLFPDPSGSFTGRALIDEGGLSEAAEHALREALIERAQSSTGPALVVSGTPEGADVYLNDELVGQLRYRDLIEPGAYSLRVSAQGYRPQQRSIRIPDTPGHLERITIELEPIGEDPWPSWLLAGGLLAGSIGTAIAPLWTLATEGECVASGMNGCRERVEFDVEMGVALGLSAALLGAAIVVASIQPLTITASASPDGARLQLGGRF